MARTKKQELQRLVKFYIEDVVEGQYISGTREYYFTLKVLKLTAHTHLPAGQLQKFLKACRKVYSKENVKELRELGKSCITDWYFGKPRLVDPNAGDV